MSESSGLVHHLPAMERKLTAGKRLPGLFEHYRLGRSQDYVVGTPGPMRATQPLPGMGSVSDLRTPQPKPKLKPSAAAAADPEKVRKK